MKVRKNHVYDGTKNAGKPTGPILDVLRISDFSPVDGPKVADAVLHLSDGTWAFVWNVTVIEPLKRRDEDGTVE